MYTKNFFLFTRNKEEIEDKKAFVYKTNGTSLHAAVTQLVFLFFPPSSLTPRVSQSDFFSFCKKKNGPPDRLCKRKLATTKQEPTERGISVHFFSFSASRTEVLLLTWIVTAEQGRRHRCGTTTSRAEESKEKRRRVKRLTWWRDLRRLAALLDRWRWFCLRERIDPPFGGSSTTAAAPSCRFRNGLDGRSLAIDGDIEWQKIAAAFDNQLSASSVRQL